MFTAALFTIAKLWKQSRYPITDEWIKKIRYLYTMEFYSAMKKNGILLFAGKWTEVENIILSEVSQAQKSQRPAYFLSYVSQIQIQAILLKTGNAKGRSRMEEGG
jgi:hypothetical protein